MNTKLLVEPIIDGEVHGTAVQATKFSLDLQITNCGDSPSGEFTIWQVSLKSSEGINVIEDFGRRKFFVGIINPGEKFLLKLGDTGQSMYGIVNIAIYVTPKIEGQQIVFLQKNAFTGKIEELSVQNQWMDLFYIKSKSDHLQETTNRRILLLARVTAAFTLVQIIPLFIKLFSYISSLLIVH